MQTIVFPGLDLPAASRIALRRVHVKEGDRLDAGSPVLDVEVDLSAGAAQECRPVFTLRILAGETATVARVDVVRGQRVGTGAILATASAARDSGRERPLRVSVIEVHVDPLFDD
jgi:hypothetical protein